MRSCQDKRSRDHQCHKNQEPTNKWKPGSSQGQMKMASLGWTMHVRPLAPRDQYGGGRASAGVRNWDYPKAMTNHFSRRGKKRGDALRTWTTKCSSSSTSVSVRLCAPNGQSKSITKNSCEKSGRSPSPLPSRTEGGNWSYAPYTESRQASPAKPWIGAIRRRGTKEDQLWHGHEFWKRS